MHPNLPQPAPHPLAFGYSARVDTLPMELCEDVRGPVENDGQQSQGSGTEEDAVLADLRTYGEWKASRDLLIRQADAANIAEARIARLMGHSRATIRSVLGRR